MVVVRILQPHFARGELVLAAGAIVLFVILIDESLRALFTLMSPHSVEPPFEAQPADGRVDLAVVTGAVGVTNAKDPRFSAFRSLEPRPVSDLRGRTSLSARVPPPLLGRVVLVSLFLGRDQRPWSDGEIARAHAALMRGGEWIEREALRWRAPVNLLLAKTYFAVDLDEPDDVEVAFSPEGDDVGPIEAHATTKALIDSSHAASLLGFRDAVDWTEQIRARIEADTVVWIVHPRRAGRSHAIPLDLTELAGVSLAVCYARESNFPEPLVRPPVTDPVTIVHELLHLFGATDKYGTSLRSYTPRTVSSREIMRLNETRLSRLRIDRLTAQELGWDVSQRDGRPTADG